MSEKKVKPWFFCVSLGLVLGSFLLHDWASFVNYSPFPSLVSVRYGFAFLGGCLLSLEFEASKETIVAVLLFIGTSLAVPICAIIVSSFMLSTVYVLDILLYEALRTSLALFFALFAFSGAGALLGLTLGSFVK